MLQRSYNHRKMIKYVFLGGTAYITYEGIIRYDLYSQKTVENMKASKRILNLVYTVSSICTEYGRFIYLKDSQETKFDVLMKDLKKTQHEQEYHLVEAMNSNSAEVKKTHLTLAYSLRSKIKEISATLSEYPEEQRISRLSEIHLRCAIKLRDLCLHNRGVYIKLGQHLAQLDYLLPKEYTITLKSLLDMASSSSYDSVRRVIFEDLGKYPEDLWSSFNHVPIASASLAQVHIAYDNKSGKKYAVKVQHEGLRDGSYGDMAAITFVIDVVAYLFKGFSYKWLAREMNINLPMELNFLNEVKNIEKCRHNCIKLIQSGDLVIPQVYQASERVLVMSFEEGFHVTDIKNLKHSKLRPDQVSELVSKTFCEQIYVHGFVHCDPHEANLLVRKRPNSGTSWFNPPRPQLVLLDHGLYRELDDSFRRAYCRLWAAILAGDAESIGRWCGEMGTAGDKEASGLLAAVLVMRPWEDIVERKIHSGSGSGRIGSPKDTSAAGARTSTTSATQRRQDAEIQAYAQRYLTKVISMLGVLPSNLLLLLKTNDCLRHIDRALGTPINTAAVIVKVTSEVIMREDLATAAASKNVTYIDKFQIAVSFVTTRTIGFLLDCYGFFHRILWSSIHDI